MRERLIILIMATTGLFSCGQGSRSTAETVIVDKENVKSQKPLTDYHEKYIDTKYEYTDAIGKRLIIQNSFPKGGQKYTDPHGKDYVYAIFWTRIINETANSFELRLDFPSDSFELPSSADNYFKIFLPSDTMTLDKQPLFDYGLTDLKSFLDKSIHKSSSWQRIINPQDSNIFYVVTLFHHGIEGVVRAGLSLKEQNLFYSMNDKEIHCGQINFTKLKLQK